MRHKKHKARKRTTTCVCSSCGKQSERMARELYGTARLRCEACGGPINRVRDEVSRPSLVNTAIKLGGSGAALEPTAQR
jgi:DNA-directed RNA polymerase subunit RPC12/RpoP